MSDDLLTQGVAIIMGALFVFAVCGACVQHPEVGCIVIVNILAAAVLVGIGYAIYKSSKTTQIAVGATAAAIAGLAIIGSIIGAICCGRANKKKIEPDEINIGQVESTEPIVDANKEDNFISVS